MGVGGELSAEDGGRDSFQSVAGEAPWAVSTDGGLPGSQK